SRTQNTEVQHGNIEGAMGGNLGGALIGILAAVIGCLIRGAKQVSASRKSESCRAECSPAGGSPIDSLREPMPRSNRSRDGRSAAGPTTSNEREFMSTKIVKVIGGRMDGKEVHSDHLAPDDDYFGNAQLLLIDDKVPVGTRFSFKPFCDGQAKFFP